MNYKEEWHWFEEENRLPIIQISRMCLFISFTMDFIVYFSWVFIPFSFVNCPVFALQKSFFFLCNQKIKYFSNVNSHSHSRYLHKTFAITNNLSTNLHLPKIWLNCLCVRIDYDGWIHHFNSSIDVCYLNAIENVENVSLSSIRTSNQSE